MMGTVHLKSLKLIGPKEAVALLRALGACLQLFRASCRSWIFYLGEHLANLT